MQTGNARYNLLPVSRKRTLACQRWPAITDKHAHPDNGTTSSRNPTHSRQCLRIRTYGQKIEIKTLSRETGSSSRALSSVYWSARTVGSSRMAREGKEAKIRPRMHSQECTRVCRDERQSEYREKGGRKGRTCTPSKDNISFSIALPQFPPCPPARASATAFSRYKNRWRPRV